LAVSTTVGRPLVDLHGDHFAALVVDEDDPAVGQLDGAGVRAEPDPFQLTGPFEGGRPIDVDGFGARIGGDQELPGVARRGGRGGRRSGAGQSEEDGEQGWHQGTNSYTVQAPWG